MTIYSNTNSYPQGALVTVSALFTDPPSFGSNPGTLGTPVDPSAIELRWSVVNGITVVLHYGIDSQIVRVSTGMYTANIDTTEFSGVYTYLWQGTGNAQAVEWQSFYVAPAPI